MVLLEAGADLEAKDSRGRTPLLAALIKRKIPVKVATELRKESVLSEFTQERDHGVRQRTDSANAKPFLDSVYYAAGMIKYRCLKLSCTLAE